MPEQALQGLRHDPNVVLISEDRPVEIAEQALPAGINRIDADHYDRIVVLRRWHREELADAENDPTLKPPE